MTQLSPTLSQLVMVLGDAVVARIDATGIIVVKTYYRLIDG
jgi:hypothetical protein